MTRNQRLFSSAVLAASLGLGALANLAFAADPQAAPAVEAPTTPTAPSAAAAPKLLSLTEIESRLTAQGIRMKEMEVHDKVLEVDGHDAQGRKVELIVDRRSGEILSHERDD